MFTTQLEQLVLVLLILFNVLYDVEIKTLYTVAPLTFPQSNRSVLGCPPAPFDGLERLGVERASQPVVNDLMVEFGLPAHELPALTIQ